MSYCPSNNGMCSTTCCGGSETKLGFKTSSFCIRGSCVEVARTEDGSFVVRDGKNPHQKPLTFTREEWLQFVAGVKQGEFEA